MIISRQHFDLDKKCVFEKLIIKIPFRYKAVFQNEACFLYFKNGQTTLSSPTEKVDVASRESVLLNCGNYFADIVKEIPSGTIEVYAIHLYPGLLKDIYKQDIAPFIRQGTSAPFVKKIPGRNIINHFIDSLTFYFETPDLVNADLLVLKIKELILLLLQADHSATIAELIANLFTPRQAHLKDVIQTHLFSNLSLSELAALAGLSTSSFKRAFQDVYNDTPANYIRTKKIEHAEKLLKQSDYSVSEICFQTGFNDASHFTKTFKKYTNQSPLGFRNAHRSDNVY